MCVCVGMFVKSTCLHVFICVFEELSGSSFSVCFCGLISHLLLCHLVSVMQECDIKERVKGKNKKEMYVFLH